MVIVSCPYSCSMYSLMWEWFSDFMGGIRFENYIEVRCDGKVVVETSNGDNITVPLTSESRDVWCVIAAIDNSDPDAPEVKNLNETTNSEPVVSDFI